MTRHRFFLPPHWATIVATIFILTLSGCHSSRKAVSTSSPAPSGSSRPAAGVSPSTIVEQSVAAVADATRLLMAEADAWIGTPYRFGASERGKGADCSGLVIGVFANALNLKLPRSSRDQADWCSPLGAVAEAIPGDLVFFSPGGKGTVNHVGIYLGGGKFVHSSSSKGVMVSSLDEPYFTRNYMSVGRVEPYFRLVSAAPASATAPAEKPAQRQPSAPAPKPAERPAAKPTATEAASPLPRIERVERHDTILDAGEARRRLLLRLNETTDTTQWH